MHTPQRSPSPSNPGIVLTPTGGGATTNEGPPQPQGPHKPPGLANVPPEDPEAEEVVETETPIAV